MANYASVRVTIKTDCRSAVRIYRALCDAKVAEMKEDGENFHSFHLKYLLDGENIPDVDGLYVDWRSYFTFIDIVDIHTVICELEQPYNANLEGFEYWVKTFDPSAEVLFYAEEPMGGYYATNDEAFLKTHKKYGYEDIGE